ncbi:CGL lyase, partial [Loxia curvirostra]|nr:CGL lyase [Loxia curvirostra]
GFLPPFKHFATDAIHAGQEPEQWRSGAVVPPISLSTTFKQRAPGEHAGYEYIRSGNPTRDCLEKAVAALDGAKYSLAYSSGMAAILNICHLLKTGDTIISMDEVYGGTNRYFQKVASENNLKVIFVDCTTPKCLEAAITPETKLVWLETPTNPMLKVIDIKACADIVHRHPGVLLAVDNSFMSAYFQVCHLPQGRWIGKGMGKELYQIYFPGDQAKPWCCRFKVSLFAECKVLGFVQGTDQALGAVPSPFDCFLCNRGLKTLHIRMKLHYKNGLAVAKFLESHPHVEKVIYPGLSSHPQYEVTQKQCTGCPGMVTFYIKGNIKNASAFLSNLKV